MSIFVLFLKIYLISIFDKIEYPRKQSAIKKVSNITNFSVKITIQKLNEIILKILIKNFKQPQ